MSGTGSGCLDSLAPSVSIAQVSHASSHQAPVGVSAPSKPSCSALRAICPRYFTDGGLIAPAAPVATP